MNYKNDPKAYKKAHYLANRESYLVKAKESKRRAKEWFHSIKKGLSCGRCGESHPACIEFHHRDPSLKEFTVGEAYGKKSRISILNEISKCDVLCSNCHRKLHYEQDT